ncbi:MAG: GAF domain-containing protein [Acidobacteria bacterium]|jgi:hypothetical protein|nr:GAF domain-containing protein [Acidobacteriota bacterium]
MKELGEILSAMVQQKDRVPDKRELLLDMSDLIVKAVSQTFRCKPDEVAILLMTADGRHLRFIAPRPFAELGTIPLTKRDAIAVRVVAGRRGEVINNVPMVKHVTFFESVKLKDQPAPIQKMVTTPILVRQQAIGVVEISRKGTSSGTAGPDFTEADLRRATEIFDLIGPYLAEARPADF